MGNFWLNDWFTHEELMRFLDIGWKSESIDPYKGKDEPCQNVHFSMHRTFNIMHRRTLAYDDKWVVASPSICDRNLFHGHQFGEWNRKTKKWDLYSWRKYIRSAVSPGLFHVGYICNAWKLYIDEDLPENKILCGTGYRTATRYRETGKIIREVFCPGTENEYVYERPDFIPYQGKPTRNNYAWIELV